MTNAEREHHALVRQLNCMCCPRPCEDLHHVIMGRYSQKRASHFKVIPLCRIHHDRLHHRRKSWVAQYGYDYDMLPIVEQKIAEIRERTI